LPDPGLPGSKNAGALADEADRPDAGETATAFGMSRTDCFVAKPDWLALTPDRSHRNLLLRTMMAALL
jgi:hypothetical protein